MYELLSLWFGRYGEVNFVQDKVWSDETVDADEAGYKADDKSAVHDV